MVIKTAKTVAEYKKIRDERIQSWVDARFEKGCVTWELISPDEVKITDQTGDSMTISVSEIEWKTIKSRVKKKEPAEAVPFFLNNYFFIFSSINLINT